MRCTTPTFHSMAGETDQTLHTVDKSIANEGKSDSGMDGDCLVVSSSSNVAAVKIADKIIPDMSDYWKKSTVTEDDCKAYHVASWMNNSLESSISEVDVPMVDDTTVVCFESHLVVGLDFPPSKFLILS
jgi:hypothetical protein